MLIIGIFGLVALVVMLWFGRKSRLFGTSLAVVFASICLCVGSICLIIKLNYSEFEPLINLFCPPADLYVPLASVPLSATSSSYSLEFQHKYTGNHQVEVVVPSKRLFSEMKEPMLGMHCKIFDCPLHVLYEKVNETGSPFQGTNYHGFSFCRYKVPEDLPRSVPLRMEISLTGDVAQFLQEHKDAELVISKGSDK